MQRWTLIITAMLYVLPGWTSPTGSSTTMASGACVECANSGRNSLDALKRFAVQMNDITDGALDIEVISDKMNYAQKCDNFVGNGEVNHWGEVVKKELDKDKYTDLIEEGPKDIKQYCPNYNNMSTEDRKALYMLTVAGMAHFESSCNFREKAPGPNGTAAGLLQLHKGKEGRYSAGCRNGDSATPERSLICGLSMLNDQTMSRNENLFSSASYWEVLRPRGRSKRAGKLKSAITKLPACAVSKAPKKAVRQVSKR